MHKDFIRKNPEKIFVHFAYWFFSPFVVYYWCQGEEETTHRDKDCERVDSGCGMRIAEAHYFLTE